MPPLPDSPVPTPRRNNRSPLSISVRSGSAASDADGRRHAPREGGFRRSGTIRGADSSRISKRLDTDESFATRTFNVSLQALDPCLRFFGT